MRLPHGDGFAAAGLPERARRRSRPAMPRSPAGTSRRPCARRACHDPDRHLPLRCRREPKARSGRAQAWRHATASPCSMRPARSTPTIAAKYRSFLSILATIHSQSNAACALHNWSSQLHCKASLCEVASLDETTRGVGGFGSTGAASGGNESGQIRRYIVSRYITVDMSALISRLADLAMPLLPRKGILAIAAVIDIALHARWPAGRRQGAGARAIDLPPRHLGAGAAGARAARHPQGRARAARRL